LTLPIPLQASFDLAVTLVGPPGSGLRIQFEAPLKPVAEIEVTPASVTLAPGEDVQLAAILTSADGTVLTNRTIVWSSENPVLAAVGADGRARALVPGLATIRATSEGVHGTASLDIVAPYRPDIVFQSDRAGNHDVYTIMRDGSDLRRITTHAANDGNAWFTGDGQRIAFVSLRTGNWDVYTMALDGTDVVNLTSHPANDGDPRPSPDGRTVTFISNRFGSNDVFIVNVDGTGLQRLTSAPGDDYWPQFTADGSKIVFGSTRDGNHEVYIVDVDGSNERNLTNHPGIDFGPHTAGGRIAWRTGSPSGGEEVWVMNEDGSGKRRLTTNGYNDTGPNLTSDGQRICFTAKGPAGHEVFSINVDGTGLRNLSARSGYDDFCWWSPDGSQLRWNRRDGRQDLWLMQADGSGKVNFSANSAVWDDGGTFNPAAYR
jgi:TolB protein